MAGRARGGRARRADARARGGRRAARRRGVPPPAAARAARWYRLVHRRMEELRERALGDGWRKLVVDGVTAEPVDAAARRRGEGRRRRRAPRRSRARTWPARLDALLAEARNVHLLSPDGDMHARRTKKGAWLVSHGQGRRRPRPSPPRTTGRRSIRCPDDHPLFAATQDLARQAAAGAALRRAAAPAAALGARRDPRRRRRLRQGVHEPCARRVRPRGRHAGRARRARREPGRDRDGVAAIAAKLGYDEARFEATAIADVRTATSRSTCSSRCTPATRRRTRRSPRACGSAPRRSSSRPAATTSSPAQIAAHEKDGLLRHGLLLGRQADLVTDALRASALEALGYRVDVIEFSRPSTPPRT